jgi:hypothetical protein
MILLILPDTSWKVRVQRLVWWVVRIVEASNAHITSKIKYRTFETHAWRGISMKFWTKAQPLLQNGQPLLHFYFLYYFMTFSHVPLIDWSKDLDTTRCKHIVETRLYSTFNSLIHLCYCVLFNYFGKEALDGVSIHYLVTLNY